MKRITLMLLAVCFCISLAACGGDGEDDRVDILNDSEDVSSLPSSPEDSSDISADISSDASVEDSSDDISVESSSDPSDNSSVEPPVSSEDPSQDISDPSNDVSGEEPVVSTSVLTGNYKDPSGNINITFSLDNTFTYDSLESLSLGEYRFDGARLEFVFDGVPETTIVDYDELTNSFVMDGVRFTKEIPITEMVVLEGIYADVSQGTFTFTFTPAGAVSMDIPGSQQMGTYIATKENITLNFGGLGVVVMEYDAENDFIAYNGMEFRKKLIGDGTVLEGTYVDTLVGTTTITFAGDVFTMSDHVGNIITGTYAIKGSEIIFNSSSVGQSGYYNSVTDTITYSGFTFERKWETVILSGTYVDDLMGTMSITFNGSSFVFTDTYTGETMSGTYEVKGSKLSLISDGNVYTGTYDSVSGSITAIGVNFKKSETAV